MASAIRLLTRSGSDKLNGIVDKVIASEADASSAPEKAHHEITAANYRVRLLGTETTAGRSCYVIELAPRTKTGSSSSGKPGSTPAVSRVVRVEGQFAASLSILVGAPRITEEFVEVQGFWLPGHVKSVTSSLLLGPTELDIHFSNYQLDRDSALLQR